MTEQCGEKFLKPYRDAVQRCGPGFGATLWSSREGQQLRFDVMIDLVDFTGCTVVDAGCGAGDFAQRLVDREVRFAGYVGVDGVAELIQCARGRNLPCCEFVLADLVRDASVIATKQPDYVCISGTLNTMDEPVARQLVHTSFEAAAQGVLFNFLSDRTHGKWDARDVSPARRFNTLDWIAWALEQTSLVVFTQDYLDGHDATIMMRHE